MSSPTVIRHAVRGGRILQVVTYFDSRNIVAAFQEYNVGDTGRTALILSQAYLSEQGAIAEWESALYGLAVNTGNIHRVSP